VRADKGGRRRQRKEGEPPQKRARNETQWYGGQLTPRIREDRAIGDRKRRRTGLTEPFERRDAGAAQRLREDWVPAGHHRLKRKKKIESNRQEGPWEETANRRKGGRTDTAGGGKTLTRSRFFVKCDGQPQRLGRSVIKAKRLTAKKRLKGRHRTIGSEPRIKQGKGRTQQR